MILNQQPAEEAYYHVTFNQFTIPLSLHLPRSHLEFHALPCCLLLENSVPASCVVKIFQSTHGWRVKMLNIKPIHKTSLSFFLDKSANVAGKALKEKDIFWEKCIAEHSTWPRRKFLTSSWLGIPQQTTRRAKDKNIVFVIMDECRLNFCYLFRNVQLVPKV